MNYYHVVYPPHQVVTTDYPVQCSKKYVATNIASIESAQLIMQRATVTYLEKMFNMPTSFFEQENNG